MTSIFYISAFFIVFSIIFAGLAFFAVTRIVQDRKRKAFEREMAKPKANEERRAYEEKVRLANEHVRQSNIVAEQRERERLVNLERERIERIDREKREAEEARMRDAFNRFMAEENKKVVGDVDKMFDEWKGKDKKEKI